MLSIPSTLTEEPRGVVEAKLKSCFASVNHVQMKPKELFVSIITSVVALSYKKTYFFFFCIGIRRWCLGPGLPFFKGSTQVNYIEQQPLLFIYSSHSRGGARDSPCTSTQVALLSLSLFASTGQG